MPWGPVQFVYDLSDTAGEDQQLPTELFNPFYTLGLISPNIWDFTAKACRKDGIQIIQIARPLKEAGQAIRLSLPEPSHLPKLPPMRYRIEVNQELDLATRYTTLIHELGHIYAGHLGAQSGDWWDDRSNLSSDIEEFEAESIALGDHAIDLGLHLFSFPWEFITPPVTMTKTF